MPPCVPRGSALRSVSGCATGGSGARRGTTVADPVRYRIAVLHPNGSRDALHETYDDLALACREGLSLAEELGFAGHLSVFPQDTFVEILDDAGAVQIAIGVIRRRGTSP
jgi:hypothetical protein